MCIRYQNAILYLFLSPRLRMVKFMGVLVIEFQLYKISWRDVKSHQNLNLANQASAKQLYLNFNGTADYFMKLTYTQLLFAHPGLKGNSKPETGTAKITKIVFVCIFIYAILTFIYTNYVFQLTIYQCYEISECDFLVTRFITNVCRRLSYQ